MAAAHACCFLFAQCACTKSCALQVCLLCLCVWGGLCGKEHR